MPFAIAAAADFVDFVAVKIQRALLSVSDKTGLVPFAQILAQAGIEIISTGGTAKTLREAGLAVKDISEHTGFPEMLDGRVKTLHPKVHGGLLYIRGNATHEAAVKQHGIAPIDLVVVNLYPFEATVAKPNVSLHDAIENIDIGGPSMLRSAAKNHDSVTVVVDPFDYAEVARQISETGNTTLELRRKLAAKVFARTAAYDAAIAAHLKSGIRSRQDSGLAGGADAFPRRWRSRCATARTRTRRRRFTANSTIISNSSTARSFPTTTFWI